MKRVLFCIAIFCSVLMGAMAQYQDATISTSRVKYWIGTGNNTAILMVNWCNPDTALAWGYRFDGDSVLVSTMLTDIITADSRLGFTGSSSWLTDLYYTEGTDTFHVAPDYVVYNVSGSYADVADAQYFHSGDYIKFGGYSCSLPGDSVWIEDPYYGNYWMHASVWNTTVTPVEIPGVPAEDATIDASAIQYWVGTGSNQAIFIIDWCSASTALAWGYRFDGESVLVSTMLTDIANADPRLTFAGTPSWLTDLVFSTGDQVYSILPDYVVYNVNGGYADVEVGNAQIVDKDGKLSLNIDVIENTQYFLSGVAAFSGDEKLDKAMKKKIKLPKPVPFNERIVQAYQKRITDFLTDEGYIFQLVTHEEKTEENKVFLTFNVEYLFKVKITEVVIAGNYLTTTWVVRHILRIDPGDVLDGDSFQYSRRNMLQTGIFQSVDIDFIDPEFPNEEKDLVVTVSESERFRVSPGVGISTDEGVRAIGSFEWKNMAGSGVSSKLSLKVSRKIELFMNDRFRKYYDEDFTSWQRTERKVNLTFLFQDTYIPKIPLSAQIDAFHVHDIRSNGGLPYMIDKNGLYFSIFRRFSNKYFISTGVEVAYRYEKDYEVDESGDVTYEILQRLVISPEIRGYIDFRDSLFFPTKGWKLSLRYQNTSSVAGDKNQYSLFEGGLAIYIPLHYKTNFAGDIVSTDRLIYHAFLSSAYLLPHSGELSSDDVLKLGGNTTMRGFYTSELLPIDMKGEMAEGKFYMYMRNELRVKLITDLYLVGFCDIGNLWEEVTHVGDGDLFRYSSGGGLLYASPIGSITAQAGVNLKPHEGENTWTIHVFLSTM